MSSGGAGTIFADVGSWSATSDNSLSDSSSTFVIAGVPSDAVSGSRTEDLDLLPCSDSSSSTAFFFANFRFLGSPLSGEDRLFRLATGMYLDL